jgi:hypothetical protein
MASMMLNHLLFYSKAFKLLGYENKPYIAQVVSKIFRLEKKFDRAKKWANIAIDGNVSPNSLYQLIDNLGQVYKTQLVYATLNLFLDSKTPS